MNRLFTPLLSSVLALSSLALLSACGGGGNSDTPQPPAAQSISFAPPSNQSFGVAPADLVATASSGLTVSFTSSTPSVCTVSGAKLTRVSVGTCTVAAVQSGSAAFLAASPVSNSFSVAAGTQTVSFVSPGNQTLGTTPTALIGTATSGLPVVFSSATPDMCAVSGSTLTLVSAGTCVVSASQAGNANYAAATAVERSVMISLAPMLAQTITFAALGAQTLGAAPTSLLATSSSNLIVTFASTTTGVCTVSVRTVSLVSPGVCSVLASQSGDLTYSAAPNVVNSFNVAATSQTITFGQPANQTVGVAAAPLSATASSGLTVVFNSSTPGVCSASGTVLSLLGAGTCTLSASQPGNASFAAAPVVTNSFTVSAAVLPSQTISFTSPGNQVLGTVPGALSATSTSGLTVTFASSTPTFCSISGTSLTLLSVGTCTVSASQAGNASFSPASVVSYSLTVAGIELFANGGFETAGSTTPADAWLKAASGYTRSTDSRSGTYAAQLASVASNAAVMLQNSKDQGGRPDLVVGSTPVLSFWAKGTAGATGNLTYALRFLDGTGNILYDSQAQNFGAAINTTAYTKITFTASAVPAGATAAFIEFSQAIGPIGTGPAGENWFAGKVLIDDLSLMVLKAP